MVGVIPAVLPWSLMPCSMDWKKGLSRPLITAATFGVPPSAEPSSEVEPDEQPASRSRAVAVTAVYGAVRDMGESFRAGFRSIRCFTYDGCQAKVIDLPYSDYT